MRILFLILLSISCLTCPAQNRLVPLDYNSNNETETYRVINRNGLTVYAESFEIKKDLVVFDIEIKNESNQSLEILPEEFYYYKSDIQFPDYIDSSGEYKFRHESFRNQPVFALSESRVNEYYHKKIHSGKNAKTILTIIGAGLVIYDAVKDGQDFRFEPSPKRINNSIARDIVVSASLTAVDIVGEAITEEQVQSDDDLFYLSDEYLFPSELSPRQSIRGKVFFRQRYKQDYYRLILPLDDLRFTFDFRKPNSKERRDLVN